MRRLRRDSVYTEELRRRGGAWEGSLAERLARSVRARDILEMDPPCVPASLPLDEALARFEQGSGRRVYVLDGASVRAIDLHTARRAWAARARAEGSAGGVTAGEVAVEVPVAAPDDTLLDLNEKLWNADWGEIPVVDPAAPGRVVGVVTRRALLGAFDRELFQRDLLLTRVAWPEGSTETSDYLELPRGHRVEVVAVPPWLAGRTLDLSDVRQRCRVTAVAVRRSENGALVWLDPDDAGVLRADDRLAVVGEPARIEGFRASA